MRAEQVLQVFQLYVAEFGFPKMLITDMGTCFTANLFSGFVKKRDKHHTLNSSRHIELTEQRQHVTKSQPTTTVQDYSRWRSNAT